MQIPNPTEIAQRFCAELEAAPDKKRDFIKDNLENAKWISVLYRGKPIKFWSFGIEIPEADGLSLRVADIWHTQSNGWTYHFAGQDTCTADCKDIDQVQAIVEAEAHRRWGNNAKPA